MNLDSIVEIENWAHKYCLGPDAYPRTCDRRFNIAFYQFWQAYRAKQAGNLQQKHESSAAAIIHALGACRLTSTSVFDTWPYCGFFTKIEMKPFHYEKFLIACTRLTQMYAYCHKGNIMPSRRARVSTDVISEMTGRFVIQMARFCPAHSVPIGMHEAMENLN
ncbi:unnamed protein product, partial [marine sediment metagenome]